MRKIPTLFMRNLESDHRIRDEVTPGCEWVLAGEGRATRKWDGTAILIRDGQVFKRHEVKKDSTAPDGFELAQPTDENTGKKVGWVPCVCGDKSNKWLTEALQTGLPIDGTYELCGPKVNGNHERFMTHVLIPHGQEDQPCPRTFLALEEYFAGTDIEGIVWWHPDGRRAKIKKKDFGFHWPKKETA